MDLDNNEAANNFQINSDFTINNLLVSFKQLVLNRHEFLRGLLIALRIIIRFSDKVSLVQIFKGFIII